MRRLAVLVPLLLAAACTPGDEPPDASPRATPAPTAAASVTPTPAADEIVLGPRSLGVVDLGADLDTARAALQQAFGALPDEDTGPLAGGQTQWGTCPGEHVQGLRWDTFWVVFTDGPTDFGEPGRMHAFTYIDSTFWEKEPSAQDVSPATAEGIAVGDTLAELRDAYGDEVEINSDEIFGTRFHLVIDEDSAVFLGGSLTGDEDDDLISSIEGGNPCGE